MSFYLLPYSLVFFLASFSTFAAGVIAWRRRAKTGGWAFAGIMISASEWAFASAVETLVDTVEAKVLWSQIEYMGYSCAATFFLLFALRYTQKSAWLTKGRMILLWIVPVTTALVAWTNPWHNLLWTGFGFDSPGTNVLTYHHGVWFWFFVLYSYAMNVAAFAVLLRSYFYAATPIRRQMVSLIVATLFPIVTSMVYVTGHSPIKGMDTAALGFSAAGLIVAWSMFRLRLLDLVPVGRAALVEHIPDAILVIDEKCRIADINPAALQLFGTGTTSPVGRDVHRLTAQFPVLDDLLDAAIETHAEIRIETDRRRYFDVSVLPLAIGNDIQGRLVMLRDITVRTNALLEQKRTIQELTKALAEIKTLSGLLPICSACKKIRDDAGYWTQIEAYIKDHSDADFTHGICPDCAKKLYPDYFRRKGID